MERNYESSSTYQQIPFPKMPLSTYKHIIKEWQGQISKVDKSMTSLAGALDTMHATAMALSGYSNDQSSHEDETGIIDIPNYTDDQRLAQRLLLCIERTVLHNQRFAVSSLQEFLHVVINTLSRESETSSECFEQLSLDAYLTQSHNQQFCQLISDKKLEQLETENAFLKKEILNLEAHIAVLIGKENGYIKETDKLRGKNKTLEGYKITLELQRNKSEKIISTLNADVSELDHKVRDSAREQKNIDALKNKYHSMTDKYEALQKEFRKVKVVADKYEMVKNEIDAVKVDEDEYEKLKNELEDAQVEIDLLNNQIAERNAEIVFNKSVTEKANQKSENLQSEIDNLRQENTRKDEVIASYTSTVAERNIEIQRLQLETQQLKTDYESVKYKYDTEKKNISKQIGEKTKTINDLKSQNERQQSTLLEMELLRQKHKQLEKEYTSGKEKLQTKDQESKILMLKLQNHDVVENENADFKRQNKKLQEEVENLKLSNDSLQKRIQTVREIQEKESKKNKDLEEEVANTCQENVRLQADIERCSETVRSLNSKNERLEEDISVLNRELEMYKTKKIMQVQLYYQRRGELISTVEEELTCLLKSKMECKDKLEVEFIKCVNTSDVDPNIPLLLLCISASRIGTDAANTIHGLHLTSKMSLLIFHHKDEHALPNQASYQVLTGEEYKRLGGIFDFAFLSGKGIYACSMNDSSIAKLVTLINTEGVAKSV